MHFATYTVIEMSELKKSVGNYLLGFVFGTAATYLTMKDNCTDAVQNLNLNSQPIIEQHCTIDRSSKPINCDSDSAVYKFASDKFKMK